jgi:hypothetical protein
MAWLALMTSGPKNAANQNLSVKKNNSEQEFIQQNGITSATH